MNPSKNNPVCDKCSSTFGECIYGRRCPCECHTPKTTAPDAWEEATDNLSFDHKGERCVIELGDAKNITKRAIAQARTERDAFWEAQEMGVASDCAEHEKKARADTVAEVLALVRSRMPDPMTEEERDKFPTEGALLHWGEHLCTAISRLVDRGTNK